MATQRHAEPWQTHVINNKWEVGNCQSSMYSLHTNVLNQRHKTVSGCMIYGYVLIKLTSMIFFQFDTLKMESSRLKKRKKKKKKKENSTLSSQKEPIQLCHTYSSCHILLCLPKAFRDAQHLMARICVVCNVRSGS